jgi:hypothetical protein
MSATVVAPFTLVPMLRPNSGLIFDTTPARWRRRDDQALTARRTAGVGSPTIAADDEKSDRPQLILETIGAAVKAVRALDAETRDVARRFRYTPGAEAQRRLAHVVESTQTLLKLAATVASIAGEDLEQLCEDHGHALVLMHSAVTTAVRAQLTGEWSALAASLEHDLLGALAAWRRVFAAIEEPYARRPYDDGPSGHAA